MSWRVRPITGQIGSAAYLGADILRHVRYVAAVRIHRGPNFLASAATKKTLADIRDLHQLEQLEIELDETRITDDDL